jgi:hypothetical protein
VRNDNHIDYSSSVVFARWRRVGVFSLARVALANHLRCSARWNQGQQVWGLLLYGNQLVLDDVTKGSGTSAGASTPVHSEAFGH